MKAAVLVMLTLALFVSLVVAEWNETALPPLGEIKMLLESANNNTNTTRGRTARTLLRKFLLKHSTVDIKFYPAYQLIYQKILDYFDCLTPWTTPKPKSTTTRKTTVSPTTRKTTVSPTTVSTTTWKTTVSPTTWKTTVSPTTVSTTTRKTTVSPTTWKTTVSTSTPSSTTTTSTTATPSTTTAMQTTSIGPDNKASGPSWCTSGDLVILLDDSRKLSRTEFKNSLEFTAKLAERFKEYHSNNRVQAMHFTSQAVFTSFKLEESQDYSAQDTYIIIKDTPYFASSAQGSVSVGIKAATEDLQRYGRHGGRWNLVVITASPSDVRKTRVAANQYFTNPNTRVIAIGIGGLVNPMELLVASNNGRVYVLENSSQLFAILENVYNQLC